MRSGFFNDTEVWAEDFARFCMGLLTNGVLTDTTDALKVVAGSGMTVQVNPGYCWIEGHFGLAENIEGVTVAFADGTNPRIDRVVARLNRNTNTVGLHIITGTPAATPVAPDVVRSANIYDLGLALIRLPAGALAVTSAMITDTRSDANVCGGVLYKNSDALALSGKADKTALTALQSTLTANINTVQSNLNGVQTNLQAQINSLSDRVYALENKTYKTEELITTPVRASGSGTLLAGATVSIPIGKSFISATVSGAGDLIIENLANPISFSFRETVTFHMEESVTLYGSNGDRVALGISSLNDGGEIIRVSAGSGERSDYYQGNDNTIDLVVRSCMIEVYE